MKKKNKNSFMSDRRVIFAASVLIAFFTWVVVAGFISPGETKVITNVLINYKLHADDYRNRGLQIVGDIKDVMADVEVRGNGSEIGGFNNSDVAVYLDFSGVTGPGVQEVPLRGMRVAPGEYSIIGVSLRNSQHSMARNPKSTVTLTFEEVSTAHIPVQVRAEGITADAGFFRDTPMLSNSEVVLTGPKSEVSRVASAMVEIVGEEARTESKMYQGLQVHLMDANGNLLDPEQVSHLSISPETIDVEIPILEQHDIEIGVDFTGVPQGLDMEWFNQRVHLSADTLMVVGSRASFQNLSVPLSIATFDISQLKIGWVSDPVTIQLPNGLRNQDQFKQVTASFDSSGLVERTFRVTNFRVENGPRNATITPVPESVTVSLIGPEEVIDTLLPENIVVQIDAFNVTARAGQQTIPARVIVPRATQVFAIGEYPIVCDVEIS